MNAVAAPPASGGCTVVLGDLDHVADPGLIPRLHDQDWSLWAPRVTAVLRAARKMPGRFVSLYARVRGMGEADSLLRLVELANQVPEVELLLHHVDSAAAAPALAACKRRPLLSCVSGESRARPHIDALVGRHRPRLVVQPIDDAGIPDNAADRLAVAEAVYARCAAHGMRRADLYVDAMSPADGTRPFPTEVSVETVRLARASGFSTIAWPGNAGLGHTEPGRMAGSFAASLVQAGLTLAVVAMRDSAVLHAIAVANRRLAPPTPPR